MAYVELHTRSAFSFLEGASSPEQLLEEAARLEYPAVALLDRDGVYGAPRWHKASRKAGIRGLVGAELTLEENLRLPVLVENREGYRNLCRLLTQSRLRSPKSRPRLRWNELEGGVQGLVCLTGGSRGPVRSLLNQEGEEAARDTLRRLSSLFGRDNLYVELQRRLERKEEEENQTLIRLARRLRLPLLATNGVAYACAEQRPLQDVLTCIRRGVRLGQAGRILSRNAERHLKSPGEMARLFLDLPEAVAATGELAARLDFTLDNLDYRFPSYPVPAGETMNGYLRRLTEEGARRRYRPYHDRARRQIRRELDLIEKLDLAGYFLIVWDIVRFCREQDILVQGRGSAANSAVCYSLEITAVDPVGMDLLFERFLSEERGEWPDIDLDLPSGERRERVIQYVYERYGRRGAAMTANVITYRGRSAAREVGKALGWPPPILDRLSRLLSDWGYDAPREDLLRRLQEAGLAPSTPEALSFLRLFPQIQDLPRHLGQHSGGMVVAQDALDTVVPLENCTMEGRTVVQWDKEDCADLGIVKIDLLGLGMVAALQDALTLIRRSGKRLDLAHLPPDDPKVYSMLQKADTVGVFQVESRAQMATLPRLKPHRFYDLVVQVAIIRPGPIVGQMVHPYLRRRAGLEPVRYPHPSLKPILERTLGVPLFQEQLLRIAMTAAGFSGGEAEELRRALGFKRSPQRMEHIEKRLREGMKRRGIGGETAETIIRSITSFALYGFPESHAASFALLAYASAYLKAHFPSVFYASLLNNQPMGFYHPATLVKDAQHRGQRIRPVDVQHSDWLCTIDEEGVVRLGLLYVAGLRQETAKTVVRERRKAPFESVDNLRRRAGLRKGELEVLAEIGALNSLGLKRRQALWQVEKACRPAGPLFERHEENRAPDPSPLTEMTAVERLKADYRGAGLTTGPHPMTLCRREVQFLGAVQAAELPRLPSGRRIRVAGCVIVRQRPATARGFLFLSLEDETGIANVVISPRMFQKQRRLLLEHSFLLVEGVLQNQSGVVSIRAQRLRPLQPFSLKVSSHDFG